LNTPFRAFDHDPIIATCAFALNEATDDDPEDTDPAESGLSRAVVGGSTAAVVFLRALAALVALRMCKDASGSANRVHTDAIAEVGFGQVRPSF